MFYRELSQCIISSTFGGAFFAGIYHGLSTPASREESGVSMFDVALVGGIVMCPFSATQTAAPLLVAGPPFMYLTYRAYSWGKPKGNDQT